MITIRYWWIDGSMDEFTVDTLHRAESMMKNLYKNPDIVMVEYFGGNA